MDEKLCRSLQPKKTQSENHNESCEVVVLHQQRRHTYEYHQVTA